MRSSATAATTVPSTTSAAAESCPWEMRYSRSSRFGQRVRLNGMEPSNPLMPMMFNEGPSVIVGSEESGRGAARTIRDGPCRTPHSRCVARTPHTGSGHPEGTNSPLLAQGAGDRRRLLTSVWRGGMTARLIESGLKVFATCPPSYTASPLVYRREVLDIARWSDAAGCEGILVYTDNGLVDPWLMAQDIITHTQRLCPLVAVQPVYMHPYSVAKMVATLGFLHGRRIYLNMLAGGFKNDLEALDDPTPPDERHTPLVEYTRLLLQLLGGPKPVTLDGRYYRVTNVKMTPPLDPALKPGVFVSGSSEAGLAAARQLGALAVRYPQPVADYESAPPLDAPPLGIRIGIIAREDAGGAGGGARPRLPRNRQGPAPPPPARKGSQSPMA